MGRDSGAEWKTSRLIANIRRKTRVILDLMETRPWDLLFTVFDDPHQIGHLCWHLHDPDHPRYDPRAAARLGNPLRDVYRALDSASGEILERLGPEARVLVYDSMGMGPSCHGKGLLDPLLQSGAAAPKSRGMLYRWLRQVWLRVPLALHRPLWHLQHGLREGLLAPGRARQPCFLLPGGEESAWIRVNLQGREPNGVIAPGDAFDAFCDAVEAQLYGLRDPQTGLPIVAEVIRTRDRFRGECREHLPDLIVQWRPKLFFREAETADGRRLPNPMSPTRTGSHTLGGLFVATGPGMGRGELQRAVPATDFFPTICHLLGVSPPDTDGRPLPEICGVDAPSPVAVPQAFRAPPPGGQ